MRKGRICVIMACLAVALAGCGKQHDHKGKKPLVEVAGKFLYQEDLLTALPLNLSAEDSVLFAENYIRNWVEDVLLFDKAENNVRDGEKVKALVENYRKSLLMHAYQEELVKQQLQEEITQTEIQEFYDNNKDLFVLENPVMKGMFIKVPLQSAGLADVRRWYKRNTDEAIENLEKYSLRHAVTYDYFYDRWRPLEEIGAMMPQKEWESAKNSLRFRYAKRLEMLRTASKSICGGNFFLRLASNFFFLDMYLCSMFSTISFSISFCSLFSKYIGTFL